MAKEIAKDDWCSFMVTSENEYFEEVILQGKVLGYVKTSIEEILKYASEPFYVIVSLYNVNNFYINIY